MKIQTFNTAEEANTFGNTVKVQEIQYTEGHLFKRQKFVVFYKPYLTAADAQVIKVLEDTETASVALRQAEMHLAYLETVTADVSEDNTSNVESGIKNTKQNMINERAKLEALKPYK